MGFNSTLVILHDALHEIKEDKDFGKKVYDACCECYSSNKYVTLYAGHGNCGEVVEVHHADGLKLLIVGANCGIDLGVVGGYTLGWKDNREKLWREIKNMATAELRNIKAEKQNSD